MTQFKIPVDLIMSKLAEASEQAQAKARKGSEVLLEDLDTLLRSVARPIVKAVAAFMKLSTGILAGLAPEISFYLAGINHRNPAELDLAFGVFVR